MSYVVISNEGEMIGEMFSSLDEAKKVLEDELKRWPDGDLEAWRVLVVSSEFKIEVTHVVTFK